MTEEEEYRKQLGIVGLQMMNLSNDQPTTTTIETNKEMKSLSGVGDIGVIETAILHIEESSFDSLVDKLRVSTFRVRLTNALNDVVDPLYDRLRIIQGESDELEMRHHHEDALYYDKMLDALYNMESKNSSQNRGIYLATKEFMRHPMWNSLRLTLKGLWEVTKFSSSVLFGFRKRKSDTDRIVDAIKEQTQWHMTKSITQQQGFFTRLLRQGVVGMPIRGIANVLTEQLGVGRTVAQRNEDIRSRGGDVSGVGNAIADFLYKNTITKKGRLGIEQDDNSGCCDLMSSIVKDISLISDKILNSTRRNTIANESQLAYMLGYSRNEESAQRLKIEYDKNKDTEFFELVKDIETGIYQTVKNTKDTQKEVKKHRLQAFWMGFLNFGAKMVTGILSVGAKLATMALSLLPLKGLGGLFSKLAASIVSGIAPKLVTLAAILLGKGGSLISTAGRKTKGAIGKVGSLGKAGVSKAGEIGKGAIGKVGSIGKAGIEGISKMPSLAKGVGVGALVGLGGGLVADHLGRDTKLGAGADVLGQTAGYASTGALIGSIVPGIGTAVGAGIGGVIGAGKGLWDNRQTLFGTQPEPVEQNVKQSAQSILPDAGKEILAEMNEKTEKSLKLFEEEKKMTNEMVTLLKGILNNTKQETGELVSPLAGTGSFVLKNYGVK